MGCNTSSENEVVSNTVAVEPKRSVTLTRSRTLGSPQQPDRQNGELQRSHRPDSGISTDSQVPSLPPVKGVSSKQMVASQGRDVSSASSQISNISSGFIRFQALLSKEFVSASKGMSYDFRVLGDNSAQGRVPSRLKKRLHLGNESQLTMDRLEEKLKKVQERKQRLVQKKKEVAEELGRPKTAAKERGERDMMERAATKLEQKFTTAQERLEEQKMEKIQKQKRREERAERIKQKANELQYPEFATKLDTFGEDENIEAPLSPLPPPIGKSAPRDPTSDDFFD